MPPGFSSESCRTIEAVTQSAPGLGVGFGVGLGLGDFDGVGDLDGEKVGVLDGEVLFDGLVVLVGLFDGVGLLVGLGLRDGLELPVGPGLVPLALAEGPESRSALACTTAVIAEPHRPRAGTAESASAGAIADPDNRKIPAPAATATCPVRTTLTGTVALR